MNRQIGQLHDYSIGPASSKLVAMPTTYTDSEIEKLKKGFQARQDELGPKDDLSPYAGMWVALRDGHVVASGATFESVCQDAEVKKGDPIIPVPEKTDGLFV